MGTGLWLHDIAGRGRADSDMGILVQRQESMQRVADLDYLVEPGG